MKRTLLSLLLAAAFLAIGGASTQLMAQGAANPQPAARQPQQPAPQQQAAPIPIVVVDYTYLLNIHPVLYANRNNIQERLKQAEQRDATDKAQMLEMQKKLQLATAGTSEYTQIMADMRRLESENKIKNDEILNNLRLEDVKSSYSAYIDIQTMVRAVAEKSNIILVLNNVDVTRLLPDESVPSLPTMSALANYEPLVMWHHPNFDITSVIEGMLVEKYTGPGKPYAAVNYNEVKKQMFNQQMPGGAPAPQGTTVASPGGQPVRN